MYDVSADPGSSLEMLGSRFSLLLFCQGHIVFLVGRSFLCSPILFMFYYNIEKQNAFLDTALHKQQWKK